MPAPYEVSPERLQAIFDEYIKDAVFSDIKPVAPGGRPTLILLGGQTAAGKSSALAGINERHGSDIAQINPDDFRLFHPDLEEIMRDAPHEMTDHTAQAMYAWSDIARDYAHAHGYQVIIENTFSRPEYLAKYARELSEPADTTREDGTTVRVHSGYEVEVVALATPTERSCLDMVGRYMKEPPGEARWSDAEYHDFVFAQLPHSLEAVEADPHVDRVIITDRDGTIHYGNTRGPDGGWVHEPAAAQALREARGEGRVALDQQQARDWLSAYWEHSQALLDRGELDARTAPTMLALHEHADRVAHVAYTDADQLAQHEKWQVVHKGVLLAGQDGVDNAKLPESPDKFFSATPKEREGFLRAMAPGAAETLKGKEETGAAPGGSVKAQDLLRPNKPPVRGGPASPTGDRSRGQAQERGKGPDLER